MKFIPYTGTQKPYGNRPAWYVGLKTKKVGDYFGSVSSIAQGETYVTADRKNVVHRHPVTGAFSVNRNICVHAGARLLEKSGVQDHAQLRCPIHKWTYRPTGELIAPVFTGCKDIRLQAEEFSEWNGYLLGFSKDDLLGLAGFGRQLGYSERIFNPGEFVYKKEKEYKLPYPRPLMLVNYYDGYHVPLYHQKTFAAVASEESYRWELSSDPSSSATGYSIQEVRARPFNEVRSRFDGLLAQDVSEKEIGWASFHFWVREQCVKHDIKTPIDPEVFALWASVYGNSYLMPELYEGGLFLAVSYLVNVDPKDPETGNVNCVEYYVHKNVPEVIRNEAFRRFEHVYEQSAREDDEICEKLWEAHSQGGLDFDRQYHELLEAGDVHWREWFKHRFEVR